jgi:hypothetical protein
LKSTWIRGLTAGKVKALLAQAAVAPPPKRAARNPSSCICQGTDPTFPEENQKRAILGRSLARSQLWLRQEPMRARKYCIHAVEIVVDGVPYWGTTGY